MLLTVDIGNTQTAIGVYDGEDLKACWRVASDKQYSSDQLLIQLHGLLQLRDGFHGKIDAAVVSSVVPVLTRAWSRALRKMIGDNVQIVNASEDYGIAVNYGNRKEIGPDRIADAVAAIAKYGYPSVVVDLGTATNIEVIDQTGAFIGGIIAPGFSVSADALFSHAARLASVDIDVPPHVVGKSTVEAVQSGLLFGEVARIDGLVEMIKDELGCDAKVIATGGLHSQIAPISKTIDVCDPLLTLEGLRIIYQRTREVSC